MIASYMLSEAGIIRYDKPGASPELKIKELWGKNGTFIYKDDNGYYTLNEANRIDLNTIEVIKELLNI